MKLADQEVLAMEEQQSDLSGIKNAHIFLGGLYYKMQRYQDSINHYEKSLTYKVQYNPDSSETIMKLGMAYAKVKDKDKAMECIKKLNNTVYEKEILKILEPEKYQWNKI